MLNHFQGIPLQKGDYSGLVVGALISNRQADSLVSACDIPLAPVVRGPVQGNTQGARPEAHGPRKSVIDCKIISTWVMSFLEPTLTLHSKGLDCPQVGKTRSDTGDTIVIATSPDEIGSIFVNSQSALVMTAGKMKLGL